MDSGGQATNRTGHMEDKIQEREIRLRDLVHVHRGRRAWKLIRKGHMAGACAVKPHHVKLANTKTAPLKLSPKSGTALHRDDEEFCNAIITQPKTKLGPKEIKKSSELIGQKQSEM